MNFKGVSQATVIRKPCEKPAEKLDLEPEIYQKLMSSYDEVRERHLKKHEEKPKRPSPTIKYFNSRNSEASEASENSKYTRPKFLVKHQTYLDMDEFRESKDAKLNATVPKNLIVDVNLPLLKSADDATLDVQERHLFLKSETPAKYHLELPLSYRVDPERGSAKFDAKTKKLSVTLPVVPDSNVGLSSSSDAKEDSGVESDHGSPLPESQISPESKLLVRDNSSESSNSDCSVDSALRTSGGGDEFAAPFLEANVKYSLPAFTCNVYDNVLAVTVHAKNVDSESIRHKILDNQAGVHVLLTSVGAGYFPTYYSLCLKLGDDAIDAESLSVEPWDNNVVLSMKIRNAATLTRYFAGINEEMLEAKDLTAAASIKNKLQSLEEDPGLETDKSVEVIRSGNEVIVNVNANANNNANNSRSTQQNAYTDDDDNDEDEERESRGQGKAAEERKKRSFAQSRSISESSGDELPSSVGSGNGASAICRKSILKSSRHLSRSVSESSVDDSGAPMSLPSVAFNDYSTNELMSESEGSSLKKTVRFNDVVSQQLYRSNSSILGQRKKNQRKLRNKKRAHERRMSESENSETEDREKFKAEAKKENGQQEQSTETTVRPILHKPAQAAEATNNAKTAVIKIECGNKRKPNKRNQGANEKNAGEKAKTDKSDHFAVDGGDEVDESFDMKNDLIFDLEV